MHRHPPRLFAAAAATATATALVTVLLGGCAATPATPTPPGGGPGGDASTGDGPPSRLSNVTTNGYVATGPWMGYGFTATDPGAATIVPDCAGAAGCTPAFSGNDFCMHGTVTGRPDYTGFAMLGWNVNQQAAAGATMDTWAVPASGGVTVTVANTPPSTVLRLQLQGTNPHDSADRWCAPLISGQPIRWTDLKTNCYSGGTPQNALGAGTMIQQAAVLVPGLQTDLPFDVCLLDVRID